MTCQEFIDAYEGMMINGFSNTPTSQLMAMTKHTEDCEACFRHSEDKALAVADQLTPDDIMYCVNNAAAKIVDAAKRKWFDKEI
jgi:hypothetical protein